MKLAKTIWQKMEAIAKLFLVSISVIFLGKKEHILQFLCQYLCKFMSCKKFAIKVGATEKNFWLPSALHLVYQNGPILKI